jgi:phosphohistidine phosphatase
MLLYLLRHAEAVELATSDHARTLTRKGHEQAGRVGKFCHREGLVPEVIFSSPVTRARQTADLVARSFPEAEVVDVPWASCGMDPREALAELASARCQSLMLVGHQPDLGLLAALLLGLPNPDSLHVRKSLLMGLDLAAGRAAGRGVLQFFLPVKLM